jgi:hypothetical protein
MKRNWYALAGGVLLAACILAFSGCGGEKETSYGDDGVPKKLAISGLSGHENEAITVSVMVGYSPKAGGRGTVSSGGSAAIDLKLPSGDITQGWTGTGGPYLVWMVVGDITTAHDTWADPSGNNKQGTPSTEGITGKQAQTDITAETTAVDFSAAVDLGPDILQLFIANYSTEGYNG